RRALRTRRCLVPADGFYEWRADPEGKTPVLARLRDGGLFAFAGLWESWRDPEGSALETFTILTTAPNPLLACVHNRMPVILGPEAESIWLDASVTEPAELQPLLQPFPEREMTMHQVSRRVNRPAEDDADLIAPIPG
ncbi:MAG: SOS response-associated peptidase, partial [Phycisphaerae bacterium]|nr:SOS response-associated peptidase [Phycisphaerae bacterium]